MTFSQMIAFLALAGGLVGWVINSQMQMAEIKTEMKTLDTKFELKYQELDRGRANNSYNIEQGRIENRQEHQLIMDKLDKFIEVYKR